MRQCLWRIEKVCPTLDSLDIGGGWPIRHSLGFEYDYEYMAEQIIKSIQSACKTQGVDEPNIYSEFGSFTVAESGATLYSVVDKKQQNDSELWYMIDSSFITTPPTPGASTKIHPAGDQPMGKGLRPGEYRRYQFATVTIITTTNPTSTRCIFRAYGEDDKEPLYMGFFHTGAYQESIGGYGGIQHCLIPAPKHVIIDRDQDGEIVTRLFAKEQSAKSMLKILGY